MNKKEKLLIIVCVAILSLNFSATIFLVYRELKRDAVDDYQQLNLYEMDYFLENSLTELSMYQLFTLSDSEYMLYFYADDCSSCQIAEEYVAAYVDYGFTDRVPIYFINVEENEELLALEESDSLNPEEFKVVYTPTLLVINNANVEYYTGSNSVYDVLDKIVRR